MNPFHIIVNNNDNKWSESQLLNDGIRSIICFCKGRMYFWSDEKGVLSNEKLYICLVYFNQIDVFLVIVHVECFVCPHHKVYFQWKEMVPLITYS